MSKPRGDREFRGNSRGRGPGGPASPRVKPTLLKRDQTSGDNGPINMMAAEESSNLPLPGGPFGQNRGYGAPPMSAFGPSTIYNSAYSPMYQAAPPVNQGPALNPNGPEAHRQLQLQPSDDDAAGPPPPAAPPPPPPFHHPLAPPAYPFYSPYSVLHAPPPPQLAHMAHPPQFVNATVAQVAPLPAGLARYMTATRPPPPPQQQYMMPPLVGLPLQLQQRAAHQQQMFHQQQQIRERLMQPKFFMDEMTRFSPTLKKIVCYTPAKKLVALVETDDQGKIDEVRRELLDDMMKYDGRSNVPKSNSSMPYLSKRGIEFLEVLHTQFPWAPYYCTLCDFHISDIFAVDAHLPTHMKEEKRLLERKSLARRFPPLTAPQTAAIERVLVEAAVVECRPDREAKLRAAAAAAMESLRALCEQQLAGLEDKGNEGNGVRLSLHGSLVSGLLHDASDVNVTLSCRGGTKFFVDALLAAIEKAPEWSSVKIAEAPTGPARIEAVFDEERVTIDWQNQEGAKFSQLLSLYNSLHEDLVQLRQIVRKWAEKCDLITPSKLSSQHAVPPPLLDVMLIHALQQGKRLPCIHEIRFGSEDMLAPDVSDILAAWDAPNGRWNFAEVFLEFLLYYTSGDVKQHVIQITSMEKLLKTQNSKFNKKHFNVLNPISEKPIAQLHKAFQCYFLNCFLTTYVHFRVPRTRSEQGAEPKALVDIAVFQTAFQSPLKKKVGKGGKKEGEEQKEEGEEKEREETPGRSEKQQQPSSDRPEWKPDDEFASPPQPAKPAASLSTAPPSPLATISSTLTSSAAAPAPAIDASTYDTFCPSSNFLDSLLDLSLPPSSSAPAPAPLTSTPKKTSGLRGVDKRSYGKDGLSTLTKGVAVESIVVTEQAEVITLLVGKAVFIHGKPLEQMRPEDYEIDGEEIYSRQAFVELDDHRTCKIDKELWDMLFEQGINTVYLAPESNGETPVGTPLNTPSSTTSSKRKRNKRKKKTVAEALQASPMVARSSGKAVGDQVAGGEEVSSSSIPASFPVGQCATAAMTVAADTELPSTSSTPSLPLPAAAAVPALPAPPKSARRVLKLIKIDSAESSEFSGSPSPTQEITNMIGALSLAQPQAAAGSPTVSSSTTLDGDVTTASTTTFSQCGTPKESDLNTTFESCSTPKESDLNTTFEACSTPKESDLN
ncbi:hypothetical protein PMAYCL1PPCAC_14489, partial [Pristionchus mayeri]